MPVSPAFRLPRLQLPRPGLDLRRWAVIACDQYTAEPAYWREVAREVGDAPSTLHLTLPEVHLDAPDVGERIARIHAAMREYLAQGLLRAHDGAVLVEREVDGRTRRGLMLELDLEHYDFGAGSTSRIRPTEDTIVARLAPRIEVRREAELELPHILVLIDDPEGTVIEPLAAGRAALAPLYETELMQGGGRVAGRAVDAARAAQACRALQALADPQAFAARHGLPAGTPVMQFAMGDGNHSLAAAKAMWDHLKGTVGADHPARHALVEVVNIHDPALAFEPIHRLLFDVRADLREDLRQAFGGRLAMHDLPNAAAMRERVARAAPGIQAAGLVGPGARFSVVEIAGAPAALAVSTLQPFVDRVLERRGAARIDYVHGDEVLERLATAGRNVGIHLPALGKRELLQRVVRDGPLPRKTFSMGHAHQKRYYVEARRIAGPAPR